MTHWRRGPWDGDLSSRVLSVSAGAGAPAEDSRAWSSLALADGQRCAPAQRGARCRRWRAAAPVGHRSSTHCAHTSQLQGLPSGPAPGNERSSRSSSALPSPFFSNKRRCARTTGPAEATLPASVTKRVGTYNHQLGAFDRAFGGNHRELRRRSVHPPQLSHTRTGSHSNVSPVSTAPDQSVRIPARGRPSRPGLAYPPGIEHRAHGRLRGRDWLPRRCRGGSRRMTWPVPRQPAMRGPGGRTEAASVLALTRQPRKTLAAARPCGRAAIRSVPQLLCGGAVASALLPDRRLAVSYQASPA